MKNKLISNGVVLGIGINIILMVCLYLLEHRVSKLESQHCEGDVHCHGR